MSAATPEQEQDTARYILSTWGMFHHWLLGCPSSCPICRDYPVPNMWPILGLNSVNITSRGHAPVRAQVGWNARHFVTITALSADYAPTPGKYFRTTRTIKYFHIFSRMNGWWWALHTPQSLIQASYGESAEIPMWQITLCRAAWPVWPVMIVTLCSVFTLWHLAPRNDPHSALCRAQQTL